MTILKNVLHITHSPLLPEDAVRYVVVQCRHHSRWFLLFGQIAFTECPVCYLIGQVGVRCVCTQQINDTNANICKTWFRDRLCVYISCKHSYENVYWIFQLYFEQQNDEKSVNKNNRTQNTHHHAYIHVKHATKSTPREMEMLLVFTLYKLPLLLNHLDVCLSVCLYVSIIRYEYRVIHSILRIYCIIHLKPSSCCARVFFLA